MTKEKLKDMGFLGALAYILLIVGGLNWGFKLFNFNLVGWIATAVKMPFVETILYGAVGLAAVYVLIILFFKK